MTNLSKSDIIYIEREERQMLKVIKNILFIISLLFIVWLALSYCEVLVKNLDSIALSDWNFFHVFTK